MSLSNDIAKMLLEMLENNGTTEIQRNEFAQSVGCVPSQINYVISSRFTPEQGYIVESRRGGGGYIRIRRVRMDRPTLLQHVIGSIGGEIDYASACAIMGNLYEASALSAQTVQLMRAALSDNSLRSAPRMARDTLRADIMRQMLLHV